MAIADLGPESTDGTGRQRIFRYAGRGEVRMARLVERDTRHEYDVAMECSCGMLNV